MRWEHAFKLSVNWDYSNKYIKIQHNYIIQVSKPLSCDASALSADDNYQSGQF